MKVFKGILIFIIILAGLVLIVPALMPSTRTISVEAEIAVTPGEVFHSVALYADRESWDPWLTMEPGAKVTITPNDNYVGSTYSWEGDKIGSGTMKVDEVIFGKLIRSSIWFGEDPDPSVVEWHLEKSEIGTHVTWNLIADGKYPFGRLMLAMMSRGMKSSFETGLAGLKEILEENPPKLFRTGDIHIDMFPGMNAIVIPVEGNMEQITEQFGELFPKLFAELGKQQLEMSGSPFAYYIDYDEETGFSHALLGLNVKEPGVSSGEIIAKSFKEQTALMSLHTGKYDFLKESYNALGKYMEDNNIEVTGGAFEVYNKTMVETDNPMEWKTLIAFPLK